MKWRSQCSHSCDLTARDSRVRRQLTHASGMLTRGLSAAGTAAEVIKPHPATWIAHLAHSCSNCRGTAAALCAVTELRHTVRRADVEWQKQSICRTPIIRATIIRIDLKKIHFLILKIGERIKLSYSCSWQLNRGYLSFPWTRTRDLEAHSP